MGSIQKDAIDASKTLCIQTTFEPAGGGGRDMDQAPGNKKGHRGEDEAEW